MMKGVDFCISVLNADRWIPKDFKDQRKYRVESLMMVKRLPHLPAAPGICLFNRLAPLDPSRGISR